MPYADAQGGPGRKGRKDFKALWVMDDISSGPVILFLQVVGFLFVLLLFWERVKDFLLTREPALFFPWIQSKCKFSVLKMCLFSIRFSKDIRSVGKRHQMDFVMDA